MSLASFNLAKLLVEKGFKGEANHFYHKDNGDLRDAHSLAFSDNEDYSVPAPSLWDVMKWLRTEHKFFIEVCWYNFPEGDLDNFNVCVRHPSIYTGAEDGFSMGDYDWATECGIEHALKFIKLNKTLT